MKKISILMLAALLSAAIFTSCGTTDETVTSSVSSGHMTVQQIKSGVKIVLTKTAEEDINLINVVESEYGAQATVPMGTELEQSFIWPFADKDKTYTLKAQIFGNSSYSEETVTFTVENAGKSILSYTDEYLNTRIILIANGAERVVKLDTSKDDVMSIFGKSAPKNAKFTIDINSGVNPKNVKATDTAADTSKSSSKTASKKSSSKSSSKTKASAKTEETKTVAKGPVASLTKDLNDKKDLEELTKGYDIIANAQLFGLTPAEMNAKLSANPKYYAKAVILFSLDGKYPEGMVFSTPAIYSNDTVYTPIAAGDLPIIVAAEETAAE